MGVYERLGVRPIINATCHWTFIAESDKKLILGGNVARIFGIEVAAAKGGVQ